MTCWEMVKQLEKALNRKLTKEEKKKVEERMHHNESYEHPKEEEAIAC